MHVVLINQFFWPDSAATSVLLTDLVRDLAHRGHQITVICGRSSYCAEESLDQPPPVRIIRTITLPFGRGRWARLLSYASFYAGAGVSALLLPRPDLIVSMTTPPLLSVLGSIVKRLRRCRHFVWEMDLYPDVALDLQVMRSDAVAARLVGWLADGSRRHADGLIALGPCMKERLIARGIESENIHIAPNWAGGGFSRPAISTASRRPGPLTFIYAGNLGLAHETRTLIQAISCLGNSEEFRFIFVGGGPHWNNLRQECNDRRLTTVEFRPFGTRLELQQLYSSSDVGLVTLKDACCGSLVPSKTYSLLAAGLPILYVGPAAATPGLVIEEFGCGWQVDCGNASGLLSLIELLQHNRDMVSRKSVLARQVFLDHFDRPVATKRLAEIMGLSDRAALSTPVSVEANRS